MRGFADKSATTPPVPRGRPRQRRQPSFDRVRRDRLQRHRTERGKQLRADDRPVALESGRLALPVELDIPKPLSRRVRERRAGPHLARQRAAPCLMQDVPQPSSASRFVNYPVGGRPRPVHAGPSFF